MKYILVIARENGISRKEFMCATDDKLKALDWFLSEFPECYGLDFELTTIDGDNETALIKWYDGKSCIHYFEEGKTIFSVYCRNRKVLSNGWSFRITAKYRDEAYDKAKEILADGTEIVAIYKWEGRY